MCDIERILDTVNIEGFYSTNVKRVCKRFANCDVAIELTRIVTKFTCARVAATVDFINVLIFQDCAWTIVLTVTLHEERAIVENWLDWWTWFEERSCCVKLAVSRFIPVDWADHCDNLTSFNIDRCESDVIRCVCASHACTSCDSSFCNLLCAKIDSCFNCEATSTHCLHAVFLFELFLNFEDEMWSLDIIILSNFRTDCIENVNFFCFITFLFGNVSHFTHHIESLLLTSDKSFVSSSIVWVKNCRVVWNRCKKSSLSEVYVLNWLAEVRLGSRFNTVTTTTIWRLIKVHRNNLFLVVHFLDFDCENHFLNLTCETTTVFWSSFICEVDLLNELLGKSWTTLNTLVSYDWPCSTGDTGKIDTIVVIEVSILDCDGCLAHDFRDFISVDNETIVAITTVFPENFTVTVEIDVHGFGDLHFIEADWFKIFLVVEEEATKSDNAEENDSGNALKEEEEATFTKDKFENAFWMEMCEKAKNWVLWHICKFFCALSCEHFLPCLTTIAKAWVDTHAFIFFLEESLLWSFNLFRFLLNFLFRLLNFFVFSLFWGLQNLSNLLFRFFCFLSFRLVGLLTKYRHARSKAILFLLHYHLYLNFLTYSILA